MPEYTLVAPHNTVMSYSNPGINLAGYIAEVVSGKHYAELMQELVFEPLQMQHTTFDPTIAMTYPLAQSHDLDKNGKLHVQHHYADNMEHYPSGFAISTVVDLAKFAIMHMQHGIFQEKRILNLESVREMHRPHASLYTPDDMAYSLTLNENLEIVLTPVDAVCFGSRWGIFEFLTNDSGSVFAVKQGHNWIFKRV